jgi:hypothetical protein
MLHRLMQMMIGLGHAMLALRFIRSQPRRAREVSSTPDKAAPVTSSFPYSTIPKRRSLFIGSPVVQLFDVSGRGESIVPGAGLIYTESS